MTFKFYSLIFFFSVYGCLNPSKDLPKESLNLLLYVNPFIGTGGHGHTFPGATRPFGMMQLSPDTRLDGWDGCSGYHYSCLLYTSPSPRDRTRSRMPSSA